MHLQVNYFLEILPALFHLKNWLKDEKLLKIAVENAVAETAFFIDKGFEIELRWFTPDLEIDLLDMPHWLLRIKISA